MNSRTKNDPSQSLVPAVARAAAILDALAAAQGQALGPSELSRQLDMAKSSVSNLCRALADEGWAQRTDGGYRLGRRLADLGAAYLASLDLVREFHDAVQELDHLPETLQLAVLSDDLEVVYLARRDGSAPVKLASEVGRSLPAHCTATGKAMLAELSLEELDRRLEGLTSLPALTAQSITDPAALRTELERVRERGYAIDNEEVMDGVVCLAKAVPGRSTEDVAAVSITVLKVVVPMDRLESLVDQLVKLVEKLHIGGGVAQLT